MLLRFLFVSSAEVYGEDLNDLLITEETQIAPTSYYGMAKYASELIIKKSLIDYPNTSYMILRPALVYGPGEEGSFYGPSGFMKAAVKNEEILLWGNGSELREFVYIDDLILVFIFSGFYHIKSKKLVKEIPRIISGVSTLIVFLILAIFLER